VILEFLVSSKSSHFQFAHALLSLLDEVSAAVNYLGLDQSFLVHFAGSLDYLDERVDQLLAQIAGVAVDELFFEV
jgi:hypothetical protein